MSGKKHRPTSTKQPNTPAASPPMSEWDHWGNAAKQTFLGMKGGATAPGKTAGVTAMGAGLAAQHTPAPNGGIQALQKRYPGAYNAWNPADAARKANLTGVQDSAKTVGRGLSFLGVLGGVANIDEGVDKITDYKNHDGDGLLQTIEGGLGLYGSAVTLAGGAAASGGVAPVASAGALGIGLGRRGNKAMAQTGLLGKTAGGRDKDISDIISDVYVNRYKATREAGGSELLGHAAGVATMPASLAVGGAAAAVAGVGGMAYDLADMAGKGAVGIYDLLKGDD